MTHPLDTDPTVGRRTVVATVGLTALAVAAPVGLRRLPDLLGLEPHARDDAGPTRSDFAAHQGGTFSLTAEGTRAQASLERIEDLADDLAGDEGSFAVVFRSARGLHQNTYLLERPGFASTPVLLVPRSEGRAGALIAVFDRTRES